MILFSAIVNGGHINIVSSDGTVLFDPLVQEGAEPFPDSIIIDTAFELWVRAGFVRAAEDAGIAARRAAVRAPGYFVAVGVKYRRPISFRRLNP